MDGQRITRCAFPHLFLLRSLVIMLIAGLGLSACGPGSKDMACIMAIGALGCMAVAAASTPEPDEATKARAAAEREAALARRLERVRVADLEARARQGDADAIDELAKLNAAEKAGADGSSKAAATLDPSVAGQLAWTRQQWVESGVIKMVPSTDASTQSRSQHLRVAVLPFGTTNPDSNNQAAADLKEFSRDFIDGQGDMTSVHVYDWRRSGGDKNIAMDSIWKGGYVRKVPRESEIYALAANWDADVALTFFHRQRTGDSYASDLYLADVYIFDLTHERLYHDSGDERSFKAVTERLFEELVQDRDSYAGNVNAVQSGPEMRVEEAASPPVGSASVGIIAAAESMATEMQREEGAPADRVKLAVASQIAVAVFPFAAWGIVVTNDAERLLPEFIHRYISDSEQLHLVDSYFSRQKTEIGAKTDYWTGGNKPLDDSIYSAGARVGADAVVMVSYNVRYPAEDKFALIVYVFDIKNRRVYQSTGDQDDYQRAIAEAFEKLIEFQQHT
jgi:hypothetical protein